MKIPAIEELKLHISDPRTKVSMDEVLSSFYSGNMRSAIVMLYATVVSDLYYKIRDLVDIYNDNGAKEILDYVHKEWKDHKASPVWESEMPKRCHEKNKILKNDAYAHFEHLQTERNLCAHPVIDGSLNLYRPNPSTVQGLIIDMLDGVLCKPSFLSKDLFNVFTDDIVKASALFPEEQKMHDYIRSKYLDKIDNEREEYAIFKKLWKLVFKLTDQKSADNRQAAGSVLNLLIDRHYAFFLESIKEDTAYYGANISMDDDSCIKQFIFWANQHKEIYNAMPNDTKLTFEQKVNSNIYHKAMAFCIDADPLVHAKQVDDSIWSNTANYMIEYLSTTVSRADAIDFAIDLYGRSPQFDNADDYFDNMLDNLLCEMTEAQLTKVVEYSNNNGQIYARRKFSSSRYQIKKFLEKKNPQFDYSPYDHFC